MAVDLHIHTAASGDGEFSSKEIIRMAAAKELQAVAITDHDSTDNVEEALYWGSKYGIEVIPGCEFSSGYQGKWLHVLGYFIDVRHPAIQQWCSTIQEDRRANVDMQIDKLREAGLYVEKEKVLEGGPQPMPVSYSIAVLDDRRNDDNSLVKQYKEQKNGAIKFCLDWLATGRPYNAPVSLPEVPEVIELILKSGGVPVLAHPAATLGVDHDEMIGSFLKLGLAGVEAFTTWHTQEQAEHYLAYCRKRGILATCGSDFHGKNKPQIQLGQVSHNTYEVVQELKALKKRQAVE